MTRTPEKIFQHLSAEVPLVVLEKVSHDLGGTYVSSVCVTLGAEQKNCQNKTEAEQRKREEKQQVEEEEEESEE